MMNHNVSAVALQEVEAEIFELQSAFRKQRVLPAVELRGLGEKNGEKCFTVWFGALKCYIPLSETGLNSADEMLFMLGSRVPVVVTEFDRKNASVTLSITKAKAILAVETRKNLKLNDVLTGIVQQMTKTTVTVDLGGVDAVMKKEDASWVFVGHPREAVKMGAEIRVKVIEIDEDGTVFVSKKVLENDPWPTITKQLEKSEPTVAEVTGTSGNGLFLQLHEGVVAMAPIPDWTRNRGIAAGKRVVVMVQAIKEKKKINCRILRVID